MPFDPLTGVLGQLDAPRTAGLESRVSGKLQTLERVGSVGARQLKRRSHFIGRRRTAEQQQRSCTADRRAAAPGCRRPRRRRRRRLPEIARRPRRSRASAEGVRRLARGRSIVPACRTSSPDRPQDSNAARLRSDVSPELRRASAHVDSKIQQIAARPEKTSPARHAMVVQTRPPHVSGRNREAS